jgi:drug/metabolite transporter (DMT)-like permease
VEHIWSAYRLICGAAVAVGVSGIFHILRSEDPTSSTAALASFIGAVLCGSVLIALHDLLSLIWSRKWQDPKMEEVRERAKRRVMEDRLLEWSTYVLSGLSVAGALIGIGLLVVAVWPGAEWVLVVAVMIAVGIFGWLLKQGIAVMNEGVGEAHEISKRGTSVEQYMTPGFRRKRRGGPPDPSDPGERRR